MNTICTRIDIISLVLVSPLTPKRPGPNEPLNTIDHPLLRRCHPRRPLRRTRRLDVHPIYESFVSHPVIFHLITHQWRILGWRRLEARGITLSRDGVSLKTQRRFDRDAYLDATRGEDPLLPFCLALPGRPVYPFPFLDDRYSKRTSSQRARQGARRSHNWIRIEQACVLATRRLGQA